MEKWETRNKYLKWPSRENYVSYKKSKNKCNSLTKKAKKVFFWSAVKPFLKVYKGCISNDFISLEKDGDLISNEKELVKLLIKTT